MLKTNSTILGFLILLLSGLPVRAQLTVFIKDSGLQQVKKDTEGNIVSYKRTLTFHSGSVSRYEFVGDVDLVKKTASFNLGGCWYGGPTVLVDDKPVQNAEEPRGELKNGAAVFDMKWNDSKAGPARLRTVILPGDDKIFLELKRIEESLHERKLSVSLCAMPGQGGGNGETPNDRWVSTGPRAIRHGRGAAALDLSKEWWLYCFDANGNRRGSCALMVVPEECESAQVAYLDSNYTIFPIVTGKKGQRSLRFILWSFSEFYKPRDSAYRYLSDNGGKWLEQLRKFDFENPRDN